jgi:hypothetical protein
MSRSVTTMRLDDEASAGWTTYGTSRAAFSLFMGVVRDDVNDSSKSPWTRIASIAACFSPRSLIEATRLEAMRTQGRFSLFLTRQYATLKNLKR